ncbi:MAG: glycoside hydrolase family 140 protein [Prolixibacteraceae bacterium]|jgi:hypothetical protein|nr:glycoside hydrolase family 140 protein [Prolixibacteraceae bacterium]
MNTNTLTQSLNRRTGCSKQVILLGFFVLCISTGIFARGVGKKVSSPERLVVSTENPHLMATSLGKPVFLNNYTVWQLLRNGSREDVKELISTLSERKINTFSVMILDFEPKSPGRNFYGDFAFGLGKNGMPNPLQPITTTGNNPHSDDEYDFWDHLDYVVETAGEMGMYVSLHPAWGDWFSGKYSGEPDSMIIFDELNAYKYGHWLGNRYKDKTNIIWMVGGDRSAVYDSKTRGERTRIYDYRAVYSSMAEGLADGAGGEPEKPDGKAVYSNIVISYHPRKWAPNSSEWFHNEPWLTFNSIQDTPYDQFVSVPYDYNLKPVKPTWLYEGRYEKAITDWGIRYQAYQTVLAGGFGHNYGAEELWKFPANWRELLQLPGGIQMKYLYEIAREVWTDKQFLQRTPDQALIIGDQGATVGDGITTNDGDGGGKHRTSANGRSDRITAMRSSDGRWALVYTANGRDLHLDLSRLTGKLNAYWFNPRNGMWWVGGNESAKMTPFKKSIKTGSGDMVFDTPGSAADDNDWVLMLK